MAENLVAMGMCMGGESNPNVAKIAIEQRKKKTEVVEPQVISEDLLIEGVEEPVKPNGEPWDPIEFPKVTSMKLSFLNIIEIANLCNFDTLTTLRLDNNIIDKIQFLYTLKNLTWLDLSFNNIREIENLEELSNLTDLSLYHNQISEIKGLEGCPKLNILSLGHNKIEDLKQIDTLRPLKNLRCLCLEGNKVCMHDSYNTHVLAHLTNLKYLDYMLIDKKAVAHAMEAINATEELEEKREEELAAQAAENARKEKEQVKAKLRESFLDFTEDLFDELFSPEVETEHLRALKNFATLKEDFKHNISTEIAALKPNMEKYNEDRLRKARAFEREIFKAEKESEDEAFQMVRQFRSLKKQVLAKLADISPDDNQQKVDAMLQQLLEQLTALQTLLMANEVQLQESIEDAIATFDAMVTEIVKKMIEIATAFFEKVTEEEKKFDIELKEAMSTEIDQFAQTQAIDADESPSKAKYLQDREEMGRQCGNMNEFHLNHLSSKEEDVTKAMNKWMTSFVADHQERQYHRNRQRIMDIKKVIEESREEIAAAGEAAEFEDDDHNGHDTYVR